MTERLAKLKELASALPKEYKSNAEDLIARMEEVVEGIGDEPVVWRPALLRLVQSTTDRSSLPKGVGIGEFVLGENKQEQPLEFYPIRIWDARQYWDPDPANSKMLCSSPDSKLGYIGMQCKQCPHSAWDEETKRSDCSKIKTVISIKSDLSDIFLTNFQKTSYVSGMELEGLMKKAGVAPYRRGYGLSSKTHAKQKNVETYAVEGLAGNKRAAPDEIVAFLKELFDLISSDRKDNLDKFYEVVNKKIESGQVALPNGGADSNLLTDSSTKAESSESVSDMSKNYQV